MTQAQKEIKATIAKLLRKHSVMSVQNLISDEFAPPLSNKLLGDVVRFVAVRYSKWITLREEHGVFTLSNLSLSKPHNTKIQAAIDDIHFFLGKYSNSSNYNSLTISYYHNTTRQAVTHVTITR